MVDTNKLRGVIAENGKTQADVAEMIGVTPKTFYMRVRAFSEVTKFRL